MKLLQGSYRAIACHLLVLAFCFGITAQNSVYASSEGQRGLTIIKARQADDTIAEIELYLNSHALIIGVSRYDKGWPSLPGVVSDVAAVKKKLEETGFTVTTVLDPDSLQLKQSFENFISEYGNHLNNRLLFYFAGHGSTIKPAYGGESMGYIVPKDAPLPSVDADQFKRKAMSMQRIEEFARVIDAKHALFLFDSCFSGSLFALSRAIPEDISYKTAKPVRQFITSGSENEEVSDHSIFRRQFIVGLDGEADVNSDGYITGTELSTFLQSSVINYSKGYQHPQYGKIRHPQLDKGDYVFVVPPDIPGVTPTLPTKHLSITKPVPPKTGSGTEVDSLIKDLAKRFKSTDVDTLPNADIWSRHQPVAMVFLDVEGSGASRGERNFILDRTAEKMRESGRYTIVEREILDKLIDELELSNSDLADPATSLRLGKILSAGLIGTGSINQEDNTWLISLRFIDTETTLIRTSASKLSRDSNLEQVSVDLTEIIEKKLKKEFPLQGRLISLGENSVTIDIGSRSGVKKNMLFEILSEDDMPIAEIEIERVGATSSIAQTAEFLSPLEKGMRVRELSYE